METSSANDIRNRQLFLIASMFCRMPVFPEIGYINQLDLLADWIFDENLKDNFHIPGTPGADICGTCRTYFGITLGGRVRAGCYICQDTRGNFAYSIGRLANRLGLSEQEVELAFSRAMFTRKAWTEINAPESKEHQLQQQTSSTHLSKEISNL